MALDEIASEIQQLHSEISDIRKQLASVPKHQAYQSNFIHIMTFVTVAAGLFVLLAMERHTYAVEQIARDFAATIELYETQE